MPLQELINIFAKLNTENIRYCHWKSNWHLSDSFEGDTDFDLLISPRDTNLFHNIINEFGLKTRYSTAEKVYPGMENYLGFDKASGKIFHLHVHFKLIIGKKNRKNYRIPIEELVLSTSIWDDHYPIRIVCPELELLLLILRSFLKLHFGIKTIAKMFLKRSIFASDLMQDFTFLTGKLNLDIFCDYALHFLPDLTDIFLETIRKNLGCLPYFQIVNSRKRIFKTLRPFRLFSDGKLRKECKIKRLSYHNSRNWLAPGGLSIAFVDIDGSVESRTVSHIKEWLGWKLSVKSFYIRSPKRNKFLRTLEFLVRINKKLNIKLFYEHLNSFMNLFADKSKYKIHASSEMFKNQGNIVIYDRFPLKEFLSDDKQMENLLLGRHTRSDDKRHEIHNKIICPDHIFVLTATGKETAGQNESSQYEQNQNQIKKKREYLDKLMEGKKDYINIIDTSKRQEQTLLEIKRRIWSLL